MGEKKKIINRDTFTSLISPLHWALSPVLFPSSCKREKETKKNIFCFAVRPAAASSSSAYLDVGWEN